MAAPSIAVAPLPEPGGLRRPRPSTAISSLLTILLGCLPGLSHGAGPTLRVGPERALQVPSAAARFASDGAIIEIDAGVYRGDVAVWRQDDLILRAVGGPVRLVADHGAAEGKGIWVVKGNRTLVEGIEFSGVAVPDFNGAGIRLEGTDLTVRRSRFLDNQMGILTGADSASTLIVEFCEFARNTVDYERHGRLGHNIYVGKIGRFELRGSFVHDASTGHNVKSRALENVIEYNRIGDTESGSSYLLDIPNGGSAIVAGNVFEQSRRSGNATMIAFAAEFAREANDHELHVVNNTILNHRPGGVFVRNFSRSAAVVANNVLAGEIVALIGTGEQMSNVSTRAAVSDAIRGPEFVPARARDAAAGIAPTRRGERLVPVMEYVHPLGVRARPRVGRLDAGAYEAR